ncbi:MAG TPA: heavy metal-binding domain-containing protein [Candidatus Dormibacteraeota bacterium]|nr:heavy metal-binding domain-containing protein [Candidatus Dormibacteraeota bacterium]
MRFLRRGSATTESSEETALRLERAERSRQLVEGGGIPLEAEERIRRQLLQGGVWTSDLSVAELAALHGIGYEPVAQVLGSSLYRLGWINTGWNVGPGIGVGMRGAYAWGALEPTENQALTRSLLEARARAIHRLVLEAQGLRADGVVGVRLKVSHWEWAQGMSEFTVLGTAVRRTGAPSPTEPFTSTLTGQDLAKLLSTGYFPVRLVMGASAQQAVSIFGRGFGGFSPWTNSEVAPFSRAMHQAQTAARQRIGLEAAEAGASGVVGVDFSSNVIEYATGSEAVLGRIVEWVILGTAVVPRPGAVAVPPPTLVVPLRSRRTADVGSTIP